MAASGLAMASSAFTESNPLPRSTGPKKRNKQTGAPSGYRYAVGRGGSIYPEQSSRQEMRGHRRAQGGPGIRLVTGPTGFCYYDAKSV